MTITKGKGWAESYGDLDDEWPVCLEKLSHSTPSFIEI